MNTTETEVKDIQATLAKDEPLTPDQAAAVVDDLARHNQRRRELINRVIDNVTKVALSQLQKMELLTGNETWNVTVTIDPVTPVAQPAQPVQ